MPPVGLAASCKRYAILFAVSHMQGMCHSGRFPRAAGRPAGHPVSCKGLAPSLLPLEFALPSTQSKEPFASRVTMRFGNAAKVLANCKLKYYRISECVCCSCSGCNVHLRIAQPWLEMRSSQSAVLGSSSIGSSLSSLGMLQVFRHLLAKCFTRPDSKRPAAVTLSDHPFWKVRSRHPCLKADFLQACC